MSLCAPESIGERFLDVLELCLDSVSQQSPHGRQSQPGLPGIRGNGSLNAGVTSGEVARADPQGRVTTQGLKRLSRYVWKDALCQHLWLSAGNQSISGTVPLLIDEQDEVGGVGCCNRSLIRPGQSLVGVQH